MSYFTRTVSLLRIAFHTRQIRRCRLQGRKIMAASGQLTSPHLIELTRRVDYHGSLLHRLEQQLSPQ